MQLVSVIIPCYNEQKRIRSLLSALYAQTYPHNSIEIVIADGLSTDNTRVIIEKFTLASPDLKVQVIDNPKRSIPSGLNLAILASHGDIIIRIDAHSLPYPDYIERCVEALTTGLGENVGGVWEILPGDQTWIAQSIARAAALPIAVGDALYRHATKPAYVETVPFGAFKREILALIGFFNESLLTNEDYEFNTRILESGGRIWLDPKIRSQYFARASLPALAKQYWRYGYWKWKMLRRSPKTLRWRQALPPLFVISLILVIVAAIVYHPLWVIPVGELIIYSLILLVASYQACLRENNLNLVFGIPAAIATMHISWGLGLLWSMINGNSSIKMDLKI
ncbi:MAG: glycosyl transferase [Chloroflexi bacterium GWB2_49_20]|nr:MAG: glycosyl transferase [Chloroflexi bacterium GWB2_49_20]OGN76708.1 MAG: glycosyl transferase [Chloroflexi bacterium GWC2_49_37]OGN83668.1 MAG: glycosyl transferase [Chloroflexi bacterium GWD2_49_16]HBG74210.1 glycosyltransferase family 2 protein [Anaerolineae bacterium]HCC78973.1 glycosyltransferase family 2 protein [Anaerolineae bacterium]